MGASGSEDNISIFSCVLFASFFAVVVCTTLSHSQPNSRLQQSLSDRHRACMVFIGIDEPLFEKHNRNLTDVVQLAQDHVDGLNDIFISQVFNESDNVDRYFRLARVQVMFGSCDGFENDNCSEFREQYLKTFDTLHDTSEFCLAYLFTDIDFNNATAGLASIGTVCRASSNTGFVTFLNNGQNASLHQSIVTFAHEVGHNFGAIHDEKTTCKDGGSIMSEIASDSSVNNNNFSSCSVKSMHQGIENLTLEVYRVKDCFKPIKATDLNPLVEISLCGNNIVEPGETCDCGGNEFQCNDDCCYPAHVSTYDRSYNKTALFCHRNEKSTCLHPRPVIFAIYLPFILIVVVTACLFYMLSKDWKAKKSLFGHVTRQEVRIVRGTS